MQSWQDRGEVADSDDEDSSLRVSQSPERAAKRLKLDTALQSNRLRSQPTLREDLSNIKPLDDVQQTHYQSIGPSSDKDAQRHCSPGPFTVTPAVEANDALETLFLHSSQVDDQRISESESLPDARQFFFGGTRPRSNTPSERSSSSLSERDVSPPPGIWLPDFGTDGIQIGDEANANLSPVSRQIRQTLEAAIPSHLTTQRGRTLRARKNIQLHPYLIDKAKYQQQCKERGLQPIRLLDQVEHVQPAIHAEANVESQDGDFEPPSSDPPALEAPNTISSDILSQHQSSPPHQHREGQQLPSQSNHRLPPRKYKPLLRKLVPAIHRPTVRLEQYTLHSPPLSETFSMPPTPQPSERTISAARSESGQESSRPRFRIPRGLTPIPLPTPQISSETKGADLDEDEGSSPPIRSKISAVRQDRHRAIVISSDLSASESEHQAEDDVDSRLLKRQQKRIKGVLPASWLRIDLRAQKSKAVPVPGTTRGQIRSMNSPLSPQKGIARKLTLHRMQNLDSIASISISDNDGNISESSSGPGSPTFRQSRLCSPDPGTVSKPMRIYDADDDGDSMENDWIDPMFAGSSTRTGRRKNKSKQRAISEMFNKKDVNQSTFAAERRSAQTYGIAAKRKPSSRGLTRAAQRKSQRSPNVQLSILDAPGFDDRPEDLPQFLKVALRRARKHPSGARHSPRNKSIRLATAAETAEASSTLHAWRQGRITSTNRNRRLNHPEANDPRHPLTDVSINQQNHIPISAGRETIETIGGQNDPAHNDVIRSRQNSAGENAGPLHLNKHSQFTNHSQGQLPRARIRNAQLEALEIDFNEAHRSIAFERRLQHLETLAKLRLRSGDSETPVVQFPRAKRNKPSSEQRHVSERSGDRLERPAGKPAARTSSRRVWKTQTHRVDADARDFRQPSEPLPEAESPLLVQDLSHGSEEGVLQGLGPAGTRYTHEFDVRPLAVGTYFHSDTFIGSCEFVEALSLTARNLDVATVQIKIHVADQTFEWSRWSISTAAQLNQVAVLIASVLPDSQNDPSVTTYEQPSLHPLTTIEYLLRTITRYFTKCLHFSDPIDRVHCVDTCHRFLHVLYDLAVERSESTTCNVRIVVCILQYGVVIALQISQICEHPSLSSEARDQARSIISNYSETLTRIVVTRGLGELQNWYEDNRRASTRESGAHNDAWPLGSLVILRWVMQKSTGDAMGLWTFLNTAIDNGIDRLNAVCAFENLWYSIFTILPALEIDNLGIARVGSRLSQTQGKWDLVIKIITRTLLLYEKSSHLVGVATNEYIRAILSRCFCLAQRWGWRKCDAMLGTIYDFFARRNLALLRNEETRGSPKFLQDLHAQPSLEIQSDDCSFAIFLKSLAVTIRDMQCFSVYDDRKISAIIWRFIPNHGRMYKKDQLVHTTDLESLRNHHDLLCTLYYASPSDQRLRSRLLELLKDLVDHSASHREACHLSIRSWTNIAAFQASALESVERLVPLAEWYSSIVKDTVGQFRYARVEVEQDCAISLQRDGHEIPVSIRDGTISRNQRQIAATLVVALSGLKHAITCCAGWAAINLLIEKSHFWTVFDLFDPVHDRVLATLLEALHVIRAALDMQQKLTPSTESQLPSEDSQDFGDSSALQELITIQNTNDTEKDFTDCIQGPLHQFLSNVLGADIAADDNLVQTTVDIWVQVAYLMVRRGEKGWASFINDYSTNGWKELRDTTQKRRYTTYFMSRILEHAYGDNEVRQCIINTWVLSLVEREAMLSYQHTLTAALLNLCEHDHLLANMPFAKETASGRYNISVHLFRQRRLAMVSSLLNNMQSHYDYTASNQSSETADLRRSYTHILRQMMTEMKSNYQDLQSSSNTEIAAANVQGAYVTFVQQIVSFLQQYTTSICPVDRFFTDSTAFPLPSTDPTYVVGRLRSYTPKLAESKIRKQLATFVLSVSERAAVDGQQQYLVNQISMATYDTPESSSENEPTLRHVLLTCILPAYIERAFASASCAWILLNPLLLACKRILATLLHNVQMNDGGAISAAVDTSVAILSAINAQVVIVCEQPSMLDRSYGKHLLVTMLSVGQQVMTLGKYLEDIVPGGTRLAEALNRSQTLASTIQSRLDQSTHSLALESVIPAKDKIQIPCRWPETLAFAASQLRDALETRWYASGEQYFARRGSVSQEITIALGDEEVGREKLREALGEFLRAYEVVFHKRRSFQRGWVNEKGHDESLVDVVV